MSRAENDPDRIAAIWTDAARQAEGVGLAARDAEVADLSRQAYAEVDLIARLQASTGRSVQVALVGGVRLSGAITRAGAGWFFVEDRGSGWLVPVGSLVSLHGLSLAATSVPGPSLLGRLSARSVLRGLADEGLAVTAHLVDGASHRGYLIAVGADFVDLSTEPGLEPAVTLAWRSVAAVRTGVVDVLR